MRLLPRKELLERAKIASGYRDTSDAIVMQDRMMALNRLPDYKLREIISKSKFVMQLMRHF